MFQLGECVVYGCKGLHQITDTTRLSFDGVDNDRLYYVLRPLANKEGSVYSPVETANVNMRAVISREAAESLIRSLPSISLLDIKSNKQREEAYKSCIKGCEPEELMRVIKTLRKRKAERKLCGKRLTVADLHYLEQAEGILFEELELVLGLDRKTLLSLVLDSICDMAHRPVS